MPKKPTRGERFVRNYALHLALIVRRRGDKLVLFERYSPRRKLGSYRSWHAVEKAVERYGDEWQRDNPDV